MEAVTLNLMWALECLMIMICLHIAFTEKFRLNLWVLLIIVCNNILFALQHYEYIPKACAYIVYVILFFYFYRRSKRKILGSLLRFVFGILLAGVIEIAVTFAIMIFIDLQNASAEKLLIGTIISLIVSELIYYLLFRWKKDIEFELEDKRDIFILFGFSSAAIMLLLDFFMFHIMNVLQNFVLWLLCCCVFLYVIIIQRKNKEVEMRDLELNMHKLYGEAYKELQSEVRKLQHDYKNQLATLHSMHLVANSLEELVEMQNTYEKELENNAKYEQIMTCCNNSILAGYLYYKCRELENTGVLVNYKISVLQAECKMRLYEIIEILGILMDNAAEYLIREETFEKVMELEIRENANDLFFKVSNPADLFTNEEIANFFKEGYSTKGDNRGIGLYRVKELADKARAELRVFNGEQEGKNWIEFSFVIEK